MQEDLELIRKRMIAKKTNYSQNKRATKRKVWGPGQRNQRATTEAGTQESR